MSTNAAPAVADTGGAEAKTEVVIAVLRQYWPDLNPQRILVVGCGPGFDAAVLARRFGGETVGIDIAGNFDPAMAKLAALSVMDAQALEFADGSFDLVYSFHALEHIPDPGSALAEMNRVLRDGGIYCVGTPNRSRLLGYIGSNAALAEKLRWNLADWQARLRGRFRNEYGAHAGFTGRELRRLCQERFGTADDISDAYYVALYRRHRLLIRLLIRSGLKRIAWPSVYVTGRKADRGGGRDRG